MEIVQAIWFLGMIPAFIIGWRVEMQPSEGTYLIDERHPFAMGCMAAVIWPFALFGCGLLVAYLWLATPHNHIPN